MNYTLPACCRPLPALILLLFCLACASQPELAEDGVPPDPDRVSHGEQLMLAEMARSRGMAREAAEHYGKATRLSQSPALAGRATAWSMDIGAYDKALDSARRWVELDPDSTQAWWYLGMAELRAGEVARSAEAFATWIEEGDARDWAVLGAELRREERLWRAWEVARELAETDDGPGAHLVAARLAQGVSRSRDAEFHAHRAGQDPEHRASATWLALRARVGRGDDTALMDAWAYLFTTSGTQPLLEMATLLWEADRLADAVLLLEGRRHGGAGDGSIEYALGLIAMEMREFERSIELLERLARRGFRFQETAFYLGEVHAEQGEWNEALRWYRRVSGGDDLPEARAGMVAMYHELDRLEDAEDLLSRMRRADPGTYRKTVGRIAMRHGESGRVDAAVELCDALRKEFSRVAEVLYRCGLALADSEHAEAAIGYFRQAREAWPEDPRLMNALAYVLADENRELREARRLARQAMDWMPDSGAIMDTRGWVAYRMGHERRALRWIEQAWQIHRHPVVAAHLGEVLWVRGEHEQALEVWEYARERWPDDKVLEETWERFTQ